MKTLPLLLLATLALAGCDKRTREPSDEMRSMGKFQRVTLNYPGRWAENEAACSGTGKWWDFGADQAKLQDGSSCIFQRETPTANGVDLEVACVASGGASVEQWRLTGMPEDRISLVRGIDPPLILARCPAI